MLHDSFIILYVEVTTCFRYSLFCSMLMTMMPRNGLQLATAAKGRHELISLLMCVADTGFLRYFFVKCIASFQIAFARSQTTSQGHSVRFRHICSSAVHLSRTV